jgi:hypothetical protein
MEKNLYIREKVFFRGLEHMRRHYVVSECHTAAITNKVFTSM